jgi:HEAT repeat protein
LAVYGIGRSQTNAETSVRYLLAAFQDEDGRVREAAVLAVGGVYKEKHAEIAPALIKAIEDPSPDVRKRAVRMLGFYSGSAKRLFRCSKN